LAIDSVIIDFISFGYEKIVFQSLINGSESVSLFTHTHTYC